MHALSTNIAYETIDPFADPKKVEKIWLSLEAKCDNSFFLSWAWMSTWLNCLPDNSGVVFVFGSLNEEVIVCFFMGYQKKIEHKCIYAPRAYLNYTGDEVFDELTLEYNSLLINSKFSEFFFNWALEPAFSHVDEFSFPAITGSALALLANDSSRVFTNVVECPSYLVDLSRVRELDGNYQDLISKNKKNQIKRSVVEYEKDGEIKLKRAESVKEALIMLGNLESLHQKEWRARGKAGSFAQDFFSDFHKQLIQKRFTEGEVDLIQLYTPLETIGFLYNFKYQGRVFFYQSGLNYRDGNNYRPGLICHYFAILHYAKDGLLSYDFLAGASQYKKSLATDVNKLYWLRQRRKKWRFIFENIVKRVKK